MHPYGDDAETAGPDTLEQRTPADPAEPAFETAAPLLLDGTVEADEADRLEQAQDVPDYPAGPADDTV